MNEGVVGAGYRSPRMTRIARISECCADATADFFAREQDTNSLRINSLRNPVHIGVWDQPHGEVKTAGDVLRRFEVVTLWLRPRRVEAGGGAGAACRAWVICPSPHSPAARRTGRGGRDRKRFSGASRPSPRASEGSTFCMPDLNVTFCKYNPPSTFRHTFLLFRAKTEARAH